MAMRHDNVFRASGAYSLVSARKNGLPPSGSTIGKSAVTTRVFAAFSISSETALLRISSFGVYRVTHTTIQQTS
jgi:hypothetical protein